MDVDIDGNDVETMSPAQQAGIHHDHMTLSHPAILYGHPGRDNSEESQADVVVRLHVTFDWPLS